MLIDLALMVTGYVLFGSIHVGILWLIDRRRTATDNEPGFHG